MLMQYYVRAGNVRYAKKPVRLLIAANCKAILGPATKLSLRKQFLAGALFGNTGYFVAAVAEWLAVGFWICRLQVQIPVVPLFRHIIILSSYPLVFTQSKKAFQTFEVDNLVRASDGG